MAFQWAPGTRLIFSHGAATSNAKLFSPTHGRWKLVDALAYGGPTGTVRLRKTEPGQAASQGIAITEDTIPASESPARMQLLNVDLVFIPGQCLVAQIVATLGTGCVNVTVEYLGE